MRRGIPPVSAQTTNKAANPPPLPSSTTIKDTVKPHVRILNWADGCVFPADVAVPIVVQAGDFLTPGSEGIEGITVEINPPIGTFPGQPIILKWRTNTHDSYIVHEFPWTCSTPGDYRLKAYTADYSGNIAESAIMTVHRPEDNEAPKIYIVSPEAGAVLPDGVGFPVRVKATDDILVYRVIVEINKIVSSPLFASAPLVREWERATPAWGSAGAGNRDSVDHSFYWTCPTSSCGSYQITAIAWDATGKRCTAAITVTRMVDIDPPRVTIDEVSPSTVNEGQDVTVTVKATVVEKTALKEVYLSVPGILQLSKPVLSGTKNQYTWAVNISNLPGGQHTVVVSAVDQIGKAGIASSIINVRGDVKPTQNDWLKDLDPTHAYFILKYGGSNGGSGGGNSSNGSGSSGGGDGNGGSNDSGWLG